MPPLDFGNISFFGMVLRDSDLTGKKIPVKKYNVLALNTIKQESVFIAKDYIKPRVIFPINNDKIQFAPEPAQKPPHLTKKETPIIFYPRLPHYFTLYFKDRQIVHIELLFNIVSAGNKTNSGISIKRKVSSGNLEADLMCMRYIGRYLFMQKTLFSPDHWQIVKIDLSAKSD